MSDRQPPRLSSFIIVTRGEAAMGVAAGSIIGEGALFIAAIMFTAAIGEDSMAVDEPLLFADKHDDDADNAKDEDEDEDEDEEEEEDASMIPMAAEIDDDCKEETPRGPRVA